MSSPTPVTYSTSSEFDEIDENENDSTSRRSKLNYTFDKMLGLGFDESIERVTNALKAEGFGVLTEIDVQATMKKKIDKDMPRYRILGACHPHLAFQALQAEPKIGTMLPCNVIVREISNTQTEISIVDPVASMMAIKNEALGKVATEVQTKLRRVAESIT